MWARGLEPGDAFDAAAPLPMLCELVSAGELGRRSDGSVTRRRALVPGCGRGYAVTELAKACDEVLGIDIAPTAVAAAEARLSDVKHGSAEAEVIPRVAFRVADFFSCDLGVGTFDVIYDYTFLCAIPPERRGDWAARMASLLRPGGKLVTIIFPICSKAGGPPFAMSEDLVTGLLLPLGFRLTQPLRQLLPEEAHAGRSGTGMFGATTSIGIWSAPPSSD